MNKKNLSDGLKFKVRNYLGIIFFKNYYVKIITIKYLFIKNSNNIKNRISS